MNHSRRRFLKTSTSAGIVGSLGFNLNLQAAPTAKILDTRIISQLPNRYHGWPTLTRRKNGQLLVVCSGGRDQHVCPFGRVDIQRSNDNGNSWTYPRTILDGPIDDRDAGVLETMKSSLLVTTFTITKSVGPTRATGYCGLIRDGIEQTHRSDQPKNR